MRRGPPAEGLAVLADTAPKCVDAAAARDTLDRLNMGQSDADAETFRAQMLRDNAVFKALVTRAAAT